MAREKILVVGQDLDSLSKMYLALIHRNYKTEVCNNPDEVLQRLRRFRPELVIMDEGDYEVFRPRLKMTAIVLTENGEATTELNLGDVILTKPVSAEVLSKTVEQLT